MMVRLNTIILCIRIILWGKGKWWMKNKWGNGNVVWNICIIVNKRMGNVVMMIW